METVPLFRCDCSTKDETQWTILEEGASYGCVIVGCLVCHSIGRRRASRCATLKTDQGEYEASLRAAVRRTEALARGRLGYQGEWRGQWRKGGFKAWDGPVEYVETRKRKEGQREEDW